MQKYIEYKMKISLLFLVPFLRVPSAIPPLTIWWISFQTFLYEHKLHMYVIYVYVLNGTILFFILFTLYLMDNFLCQHICFWGVYGRPYYRHIDTCVFGSFGSLGCFQDFFLPVQGQEQHGEQSPVPRQHLHVEVWVWKIRKQNMPLSRGPERQTASGNSELEHQCLIGLFIFHSRLLSCQKTRREEFGPASQLILPHCCKHWWENK